MKTTDFTSNITSDKLNETLFKKFGARINFESYDREELEKYRNLLRTRVHQTESSAKFNDLLSNEAHQKDKHMLELLNTKIKEMLGESKKSNLVKKNKAGPADEPVDQDDDADDKRWDDMDEGAKVDRQAKHITKSMMKAHPGMSKDDAEGAAWAHIKHPKKKKKAEEGIEETNMKTTNEAKKKGDGNLANNAKPYDKITRGDVIAGRLGKDEKGGKANEGWDDMEADVKKRAAEKGSSFRKVLQCPINEFKPKWPRYPTVRSYSCNRSLIKKCALKPKPLSYLKNRLSTTPTPLHSRSSSISGMPSVRSATEIKSS